MIHNMCYDMYVDAQDRLSEGGWKSTTTRVINAYYWGWKTNIWNIISLQTCLYRSGSCKKGDHMVDVLIESIDAIIDSYSPWVLATFRWMSTCPTTQPYQTGSVYLVTWLFGDIVVRIKFWYLDMNTMIGRIQIGMFTKSGQDPPARD